MADKDKERGRSPAVVDSDRLAANGKLPGEDCAKNPSIGLITATGKPFGQ